MNTAPTTGAQQREVRRFVRGLGKMITGSLSDVGADKIATVEATSPFTVVIDGASTPVPASKAGSYSPVIGHRVHCRVFRSMVFVTGDIT